MRCSSVQRRLSEWIDGELPPAAARALRAHLERCRACRGIGRDLRAMVAAAAELGSRDAPVGMFSAIVARLDPSTRRSGAWRFLLAGATVAALIVALLLAATPRDRGVDRLGGVEELSRLGLPATDRRLLASARRELARAELHYRGAIDKLRQIAAEDSAAWSLKRRARYQRKLALIEVTVARFRRTAGLAPVDPGAQQLLFGAYRVQIGFMQRAILDDGAPATGRQ